MPYYMSTLFMSTNIPFPCFDGNIILCMSRYHFTSHQFKEVLNAVFIIYSIVILQNPILLENLRIL